MNKKKILFIDRDGTLIDEPKDTFQIDSIDKLFFLPNVISSLKQIAEWDEFKLVMVSNQDGLGTDSFPFTNFEIVQNTMLRVFKSEGIVFDAIHIDDSFDNENKNTRKPRTGMLTQYFNETYDLENSYVIGDRATDIQLAKNLGAKGILYSNNEFPDLNIEENEYCKLKAKSWEQIVAFLKIQLQQTCVERKTRETDIKLCLYPDQPDIKSINSGLSFLDHMLEQIVAHGSIGMELNCAGDLNVDEHHTIEDVALVLGVVIRKIYTKKQRYNRYAFVLPMDDCLAQVAIDLGGRSQLVWDVEFKRERIGDVPTEMFKHFFKSFTDNAKCNLNIKSQGENEHHKIEGVFKAFAKTLNIALSDEKKIRNFPSSKGVI